MFEKRGFSPGIPEKQSRFERIGRDFLAGYHASLEADDVTRLERRLAGVELDRRGFAFEGAAMALALRAALSRRRSLLEEFLDGPARAHIYTALVGVGWAAARLPRALGPDPNRFDSVLRYLVFDGWGFHEGYFHPRRAVAEGRIGASLRGYERRAFDQGLGRFLWFHDCADVSRVPSTIASFARERQSDLWSGVGLACAYAGGANEGELARLERSAASHRDHLAQGVAFAAKAHQRAGAAPRHTRDASRILCGVSFERAAEICDEALAEARGENTQIGARNGADAKHPCAYELWRARVRDELRAARGSAQALLKAESGEGQAS